MPRRNRTSRRGARRRSVVPPSFTAPASDIKATDRMALELVRTGKASAAILGSYLPPKPRTTDERNHA